MRVNIDANLETKKHSLSFHILLNQGRSQASVSSLLIVAIARVDGVARPTISRLVFDSSGLPESSRRLRRA